MLKKILQFTGLGVVIYLIVALFVSRGMFLGIQNGLQNRFYDFASASSEIVVVGIDEESLAANQLGPLQQWPRANYAQAIETLNEAGAAAIGIDITFPDLSSQGAEDDVAFKKVLDENKNVVIAGHIRFEESGRQVAEWPNASILEADPTIGWINVSLDDDGFVRKIPIYASVKDKITEAFSLQLARKYLNADAMDARIQNGHFQFDKDTRIPVISRTDKRSNQEHHFMYINYSGEPGSYAHVSMGDLLSGNFVDGQGNKVDFQDKIVLIGPTAIDLGDYYSSPVGMGQKMAGVEIHANNIQTIIDDKFLRNQSPLSLWLTLLGLLVFNLLIFGTLRMRWAIPIVVAELIAILISGIVGYEFKVFLNVVYPFLITVLAFVGAFLLRYFLEQKDRKFIEGAFGHYVNKSVVEQIMKDPSMLELGGAKKEATMFFSDIAGFTSLSEKMEPGQLVQFLNGYLNEMTNIILNQQGTLDKYEGDAVMAFWGAPTPLETHAKNACLAALENQTKLAELDAQWKAEGLPEIKVRIGINSGEVIAGNMGSENRFDYTVMGDNVNLASRLEGINKQYGTEILISESTYEQVKDELVCRELDVIRVKGKEQPVRIYELVGTKENVTPEKLTAIAAYENALKLYSQKNFMAAKADFAKLTSDPAAMMFVERCDNFIKTPPDSDWDGVYTFDVK